VESPPTEAATRQSESPAPAKNENGAVVPPTGSASALGNGIATPEASGFGGGNGHPNSAERPFRSASEISESAGEARPQSAAAPTVNHKSNGGNGRALRDASLNYSPASAPLPRRVIVTLQASGDKDRDIRRIRRLHGLLTSYPGEDHFEFRVMEYNQRNYQLAFPNETTGYCQALERQLTELLGPGRVEVREL
jgi:hypothetical protein